MKIYKDIRSILFTKVMELFSSNTYKVRKILNLVNLLVLPLLYLRLIGTGNREGKTL